MPYTLHYHSAIKKDLKSISDKEKKRIQSAIEKKIALKPTYFGSALKGSLKPCFKFRVGSYRIIYDVVGQEVHILIIGHRKDIYPQAEKRK
jgi:mRNA interferase RelE/StbE